MLKPSILALSVAAVALSGCMGNTASGSATGNAVVQAAAAQALANGAVSSSNTGNAAALVAASGGTNALIANNAAIGGLTPSASAFVGGYSNYSCEQLNATIASLAPSQATAGLAGIASIAGIFGAGRGAQAASVLNSQAAVSQTQAAQLEAARAVHTAKGC